MSRSLMIGLALVLLAGEATADNQSVGVTKDGLSWRERAAMNYAKKRLSHRFPTSQYQISVKPVLLRTPDNQARPVTGVRPIAVEARVRFNQKVSRFKRWKLALNPSARAQWYVSIKLGSEPAIVSRHSTTLLSKVRRTLAVGEALHDITHSRGVREGALSGLLGALAFPVSKVGTAAAVVWGFNQVVKGLKRRKVARNAALTDTVGWVKHSMTGGVKPTPIEAFDAYKKFLTTAKSGTHPGSMKSFLDRLALNGL